MKPTSEQVAKAREIVSMFTLELGPRSVGLPKGTLNGLRAAIAAALANADQPLPADLEAYLRETLLPNEPRAILLTHAQRAQLIEIIRQQSAVIVEVQTQLKTFQGRHEKWFKETVALRRDLAGVNAQLESLRSQQSAERDAGLREAEEYCDAQAESYRSQGERWQSMVLSGDSNALIQQQTVSDRDQCFAKMAACKTLAIAIRSRINTSPPQSKEEKLEEE
jgi:hypothetical protein